MFITKNFISEKRAKAFAAELRKQPAPEDVKISSARDGFNQTQYRVEWYIWKEA